MAEHLKPESLRLNRLKIQLMIPLVSISIKLLGIKRTCHLMAYFGKPKSAGLEDSLSNVKCLLKALRQGVEQTFWKGNCLSRSLVLYWMLKRRGISAEFYIGVKTQPEFKAHAWVEHKGAPLNIRKKMRDRYQTVDDLTKAEGVTFV